MPRPIGELTAEECRRFRLIASDIDDTMTSRGRLASRTLALLERARDDGLRVLIVTGRPAGFVMGLAAYLPGVEAVIGENGGVLAGPDACRVFPAAEQDCDRLHERLQACHREVAREAPGATMSGDSFARRTDLAYLVEGMSQETRASLDRVASRHGFATIASSIHVHVKLAGHEKGRALADWMRLQTPPIEAREALTVGDSLTDATLFDTRAFPYSVGVANVRPLLGRLETPPAFLTDAREGEGFAELLELVLRRRRDGA
ncbi:MAG: HAD-IIB family hydrolase [Candidatus Wallbacteria bacterium]|nr:HAD-IIB family hydrolase [Candidatus Wallbacteria bacterium]